MKRLAFLLIGIALFPLFSHAGGIVTNTNQSAAWVRMFARDASTGIDAVYFNPAGLAKLENGLYVSLNEQMVIQNRYITSDYPNLNNNGEYEGSVFAPIFPGIYLAYKYGKFAFSVGINPIGGGGSATFENSLPDFDMQLSVLPASLNSQLAPVDALVEYNTGTNPGFSNVTGYDADVYFEGSSVYWGYQAGITYSINDMIAAYAGIRYVSAKNTYSGHLNDVVIDAPTIYGGTQTPGDYLRTVSAAIGGNASLEAGAAYLDNMTADKEVEVTQTGSGMAPIIGLNLSLNEKLNIGMKYEFLTKIELENDTKTDETGMFPDKETFRSDMPAMFSIGADYKLTEKFSVATGFHYYFDKGANYGKQINGEYVDNDMVINKGLWEFSLGLQYNITEKLLVSCGYLHTQIGVKEVYQSNLSYTNSSNSVGLGGAYKVTPGIELNLGIGYTTYETFEKNLDTYVETYDKDNLFIALGLDFKLFGKK